jgi:hypothetical protein
MKANRTVLPFLMMLCLAEAVLTAGEPAAPAGSSETGQGTGSILDNPLPGESGYDKTAGSEYSRWSLFGGLNLLYNSDGEGISIPGMQPDGSPGGLTSAPSPIAGILGGEYRYPLRSNLVLVPSISLFAVRFLWDESSGRALPAEIEHRTAYVPALMLDCPVLYTFERGQFLYSFGGGVSFLVRFGFLDSGVDADEIRADAGETLTAGEQVGEINKYLWSSLRFFYPTLQGSVRYKLETGWGAGLVVRAGLPLFNLWSSPSVPLMDSFMLIAALEITPPARMPSLPAVEYPPEVPSVTGNAQTAGPAQSGK